MLNCVHVQWKLEAVKSEASEVLATIFNPKPHWKGSIIRLESSPLSWHSWTSHQRALTKCNTTQWHQVNILTCTPRLLEYKTKHPWNHSSCELISCKRWWRQAEPAGEGWLQCGQPYSNSCLPMTAPVKTSKKLTSLIEQIYCCQTLNLLKCNYSYP